MKTLLIDLELLEPVLVPRLAGDPNSVESLPYVPGSALMGALVGRYISQQCGGDVKKFDAADPTVRRLFFNNVTHFLNAYPASQVASYEERQRFLPTPRSLRKRKSDMGEDSALAGGDTRAKYSDHAVESPSDADENVQWKNASAPFCTLNEADFYLLPVEQQLNVHNARSRRAGRAVTDTRKHPDDAAGAIFRYRAITNGQTLLAAITCADNDEELLGKLLQGNGRGKNRFKIGKSSQATYGAVAIRKVETKNGWRECGGVAQAIVQDQEFVVTLLSDTILCQSGSAVVDGEVIRAALQNAWKSSGVALELIAEKSFIGAALSSGFNRKWNLPLPQVPALAMGSVLTFKLTMGEISADAVKELENKGLGARRGEGFGRLAIGWQQPQHEEYSARAFTREDAQPVDLQEDAADRESRALAQHLADVCFRATMEIRPRDKVHTIQAMENAPSNSQLQELCSVIARELSKPQPSCSVVRNFMQHIRDRATSRQQFEGAKLENHNLLEWIENLLPEDDTMRRNVWRQKFRDEIKSVGGMEPKVTQELCDNYLLQFLDAVLSRAVKQRRGREGDEL